MSISKKLAAVVSAAAVVASMFVAAAPANAETAAAFINRTVGNSVQRQLDAVTHTAKFYAGEEISLYMNGSIKSGVLTTNAGANTVLTVDGGYSIVSGTVSSSGGKSIYVNGQMGASQFNEMSSPSATEFKITKTLDAAATSISINVNIGTIATTDVVVAFNPVVKLGEYVVTADDYSYGSVDASSRAGGSYNPTSNGKVRVGRAEDTNMGFYTDAACVNTAGLVSGDVLEASMTVSDGTSNVGETNPYWQIKNAEGMSSGMGTEGSTFTFTSVAAGSTLSVDASVSIPAPVADKTYTFGEFKVVKQGSTENLMIACGTSAATAALTVAGSKITAALDTAADSSMMGQKYDSYVCALYASTDASRSTVVKSSRGYRMMSTPGAPITTSCSFDGVAAGTYVVGLRGTGWKGVSDEVIVAGTATVTGSTPVVVKKAPKAPTVATKLKIGKTLTVALHATKGTASKGANADGLPAVVTVAAASKAICSVAKVIKSKKITGYTVKGLKAGKCSVVVTITGSSTFNALTKTTVVTVAK